MTTTRPSPMQQKPAPEDSPDAISVLIESLGNLTEGLQSFIKNHLELARHELASDAKEVGKDLLVSLVSVGMLLLGYLLLLGCAILFSAWFGGIKAMAITTLVLSLLHLGGGALALLGIKKTKRSRHYGLALTKDEIQRSAQWVETKISSEKPPLLPEPSNQREIPSLSLTTEQEPLQG